LTATSHEYKTDVEGRLRTEASVNERKSSTGHEPAVPLDEFPAKKEELKVEVARLIGAGRDRIRGGKSDCPAGSNDLEKATTQTGFLTFTVGDQGYNRSNKGSGEIPELLAGPGR